MCEVELAEQAHEVHITRKPSFPFSVSIKPQEIFIKILFGSNPRFYAPDFMMDRHKFYAILLMKCEAHRTIIIA